MQDTLFLLVISGTDTIKHQGISAAGANHEMLPYTAALDAEFVYYGQTKTLNKLPISPSGIVSPALISKACLNLLGIDMLIIDTGAHVKPQCHYINIKENAGADIGSGQAMTYAEVLELYQAGTEFQQTIKSYNRIIIAECIVGGTTTAMGLLEALGYKCSQMLSSSFPYGNHNIKEAIVQKGLERAVLTQDPLSAVAAMGDPMQAFVAGLAQRLIQNGSQVTLAGGTQMIAVATLIKRLSDNSLKLNKMKIVTTPWVMNDKSAKFQELHQLCCPEIQVQSLDDQDAIVNNQQLNAEILKLSDNALSLKLIIERYEEGHVKEGVGMGALLNLLRNCPFKTI